MRTIVSAALALSVSFICTPVLADRDKHEGGHRPKSGRHAVVVSPPAVVIQPPAVVIQPAPIHVR